MFDTNVLISGYLWKGATRRALDQVCSGQWTLLRSQAMVEEFIRVLAYEKFGLRPAEIQPFIADLSQISEFVQVRSDVRVITEDPTDNIFLNLAVDGAADVVVSGDRHLLAFKEFERIPILSVRSFLLRAVTP